MTEAVIMNLENTSIVPTQNVPGSGSSNFFGFGWEKALGSSLVLNLVFALFSGERTAPYLAAAQIVLAFFAGFVGSSVPDDAALLEIYGRVDAGQLPSLFKLGNAADICAMLTCFATLLTFLVSLFGGIAGIAFPTSVSALWKLALSASCLLSLVSIAVGGSFLRQLRSAHALPSLARPTVGPFLSKHRNHKKPKDAVSQGRYGPTSSSTIHTGAVPEPETTKAVKTPTEPSTTKHHIPAPEIQGHHAHILIFIYSEPKILIDKINFFR